MKVLFYIDCMQMGGANRVMANISAHFAETGKNVVLVNDIEPEEDKPEYQIHPQIKRVFLDGEGRTKGMKNIRRIFSLRRLVRRERPDAVVSFMGPPNIRMLLATVGLRTRKIVSVRNDPYREYGSGLRKIVANLVFLIADGCVFQTEEASCYFIRSVRNKSTIIFNLVNEKFYRVVWEKRGNEIAVVGRLQTQKNPLLALEAFIMIADHFPDHKLVFYGDDELKTDILRRSKEAGVDERVIVFGKTDEVEKKLAQSALYILSSDYEGMPNALMEAMAVGVPVISTDCPCGGPRNLIENPKQGKLIPCGDKVAMAKAMTELLLDVKLQLELSKGEKERAKAFSPDKIFAQWEQFILHDRF